MRACSKEAHDTAMVVPARLTTQLPPLLGRDMDLLSLIAHLSRTDTHLATLTGPGGVGKSRLAIQAAEEAGRTIGAVVAMVDLHEVEDGERAMRGIACALIEVLDLADRIDEDGPISLSSIVAMAPERDVLLLLDGCEQVRDTVAAAVRELLDHPGGVRVLATSRRPLGLYGERLLPVRPLPVSPLPHNGNITELHEYPSIALFVDRARAIDPSFALTEANAGPVAEICARTDGLPLAIELVAARMRIFPVATLAARLRDGAPPENSGPTDKPARHQSLHTLTATSFRLLDQEQQHLLTRMSVCAGDMSLQTVEAIGAMPGQQTERALEALVDLNLVVVRHGTDEPRFAVLETVRVFCKRELKQRGELRKARRDHADHFRELAENARPHLTGSEQGHWIRTLAAANGDLRAAVDFLRETDRQAEATATVLALHRYWLSQGYLEFGAQHLAGANAPGETGAALAMATGAFAVALGDVLRASESFHRAAIAYGENGDQDRSNSALAQHYAAGCHAGRTVDPGCVKNVIRSSGRHDAPIEIGDAALALGVSSDDLDRSADLLEAASEVYARRKDARGAGLVLAEQAEIAVARNEFGAAERLFRLSLEQLRSIREQTMLPTVLDGYALLLWQQVSGQEERVVRVLAGSSALRKHTNAAPLRIRRSMPSGPLRQLRRTLGVPEFDMLWNEGRRLTPDAAAAEMLSAPLLLDTHRATATPQDAGLTPRQFQIASLVAQGMTNRQIARNLQISEWTAVNHVRQIMRKLGLPSRIHIAQWLLTVNDPDSPH